MIARFLKRFSICCGMLFCSPAMATTVGILDAEFQTSSSGSHFISGPVFQTVAQSFTVETDGQLVSAIIPIRFFRHYSVSQPLVVSLMTTNNNLPENVIGSVSFAAEQIESPDFVDLFVDFRQFDFRVRQGDVLALAAQAEDPVNYGTGNFFWQADPSNAYAGGQASRIFNPDYDFSSGPGWIQNSNWDLAFETYVAPVPVPATGGMLFTVVAFLGFCGRRRKHGLVSRTA